MLQSIGLFLTYMLPVFILFYLAIDVHNRNPGKTEYHLVSLLILCFSLMFAGEYVRQLLPISYSSTIVNDWFGNIGFLAICFGLHFHFKITKISDKLPKWLYLGCSYILIVPGVLSLIFQKHFYDESSFYQDGIWIRPVLNAHYILSLTIGISIVLVYCWFIIAARMKTKNSTQRKRLTVLLWGAISILVLDCLLGYFQYENLPPYPHLFADVVWVCFLRWSMVIYNFLPSHTSRFHTLFELIPAPVVVCDEFGRVMEMNPAATLLLGSTAKSVYELCTKETKGKLEEHYQNHFQSKAKFADFEIELKNSDGKPFLAVLDADFIEIDTVENAILLIRDVTERNRYKAYLEYIAFHDSLTGLPDRKMFTKLVEESLEKDSTGNKIAVLYLDGDGFKQINDTLGHDAGDRFLVLFAQRLRECIEQQDVLSRFGGDEFVILISHLGDDGEVIERARRILKAFRKPFQIDGKEFYVTCSIGIYVNDESMNDALTVIRYADMAMYEAKAAGKNTYRLFEPKILRTVLLENQLRNALEKGEFYLEFQPLVRIGLWRVSAFEALIRWNHPQLGVIPPSEFITLAEKTGEIVDIGEWVLETACKETVATALDDVLLGVNVSFRQIREQNFVHTVENVLNKTGYDPKRLVLEITESALIEDAQTTIECLHALKLLGIQLAIDDFGTGFSSLSYLIQFPIDIVKIDRSFVQGILLDKKKLAVMTALMTMCKTLGIIVVVEGVETNEQIKLLRDLGCDVAQGYLFGRSVRSEFMVDIAERANKTLFL